MSITINKGTQTGKTKSGSNIRLDIQALRAVAVLGVLIYHINSDWLSGGLIGVDVFFVLSGYLISAHLISELNKNGKINFADFWARRVKRLLPASLAVLLASFIGVLLLVPDSIKSVFYRDITASVFYAANWVFAGDSSDYFAADNAASPVLHFWSLGVEEQFYLFWPLLLVAGWITLGRFIPRSLALSTAVLLFSIPSLILSISMVLDKNPAAYYVTTTRVWEFGVGALVAILLSSSIGKSIAQTPMGRILSSSGWAIGFTIIFAYMALFKTEYGFPGLNAIIPVLATALILIGKPNELFKFSNKVIANRPLQYTGAISYSIYLWHWVLLVLMPYFLTLLGREFANEGLLSGTPKFIVDILAIEGNAISDLSIPHIAIIVLLTFLFAGLTTKFIENPIRFSPLFKNAPNWAVFIATLLAMAALSGAVKIASDYNSANIESIALANAAAEAELSKALESEDANELADLALGEEAIAIPETDQPSDSVDTTSDPVESNPDESASENVPIVPSPSPVEPEVSAVAKPSPWNQDACRGPAAILVSECDKFKWDVVIPAIGATEDTAGGIKPVWTAGEYKSCLSFGDNYDVQHCIYGVKEGSNKVALIGDSHAFHWLPAFNNYAKNNDTQLHFFARSGCPMNLTARDSKKEHAEGCMAWSKGVQELIIAEGFDLVVVSNYGNTAFNSSGFKSEVAAGIVGYKKAWNPIIKSGAKLIILKDTPFIGTSAWNCAVANPNNLNKCTVSQSQAFKITDERIQAAKDIKAPVLDMTKYFCSAGSCPIEIGGIRVYRDSNHMSGTYNLMLAPYLTRELDKF
jgi:peptidoglycan/LPS O-acetylase OafA/YrhL